MKNAISTKTNFEALFADETLPKPLTAEEKEGLDIKIIKGGNKIKFKDHFANSGKEPLCLEKGGCRGLEIRSCQANDER